MLFRSTDTMNLLSSFNGNQPTETSEANQHVLGSGIREMLKKYNPAWWYCHNLLGPLKCHMHASPFKNHPHFKPERVYLDHEKDGKIVLDVIPKKKMNEKFKAKEITLIMLHGVSGSSNDPYMQDLSGTCSQNGINVV